MSYQPIENYGVIGNLRTIALVGMDGSIDWFCFPNFDSPSVFAAILDHKKGGYFKVAPVKEGANQKQFYWPETNVLVTRFLSPDGVAEITDYMPVGTPPKAHGQRLVRRVKIVRGSMKLRMQCYPAFNYGRDKHETWMTTGGVCFHSSELSLGLTSSVEMKKDGTGIVAEFGMQEGQNALFILEEIPKGGTCRELLSDAESVDLFKSTVEYWHNWLSKSSYTGRWREMVQRSALVLKLLTFEPTGAIVAAPTCSLPEAIGGERNWDYRYTWIRDAAFTLYGLLRIGFTEEAAKFMNWIEGRCHELKADGSLQIMYGIDGRHELLEETLDHFEGYKGSQPVRIGNGAYDQLQLDIYGELMDSVYLYNKYGSPISYDLWTHLRRLINWVCDNWQRKDEGIWEVRGGQQHFVYSKLMCWVAVDRALRLAEKRSFPADHDRWLKARDTIYEEIMSKGWNSKLKTFVQAYNSETLDAANLMMPLVFFLSPTDPRNISTIDATMQSPGDGGLLSNSLVYRYNIDKSPDGLSGEEGTFNICTFWLVEALTRAGRTHRKRLERARLMFEQMLGYANHLGLFSEETGSSGEALGNFPQAFTHLALISAAYNLDRALGSKG
ncbi:glycoside hydrolase family 15 protein [candidate division KSB1 bacterium]|nr:glycoside hydrolase family 15 protein [candidate division KSB1 bacterium]NIR70599.1 glycoside hydrolase family 15 protein [candidate division KSB1 bacterium]NIS24544.1 glycoside hydrolase family 15 protein [candidate division KSB1 bacterium]NIT71462.1 glycoside hydrolase family 15 protein [candidate division KSB1 bacterium]NIU25153.1 glycoside hydrolase family 15 protein [candidate division KSB1 bacterium]